MKVFYAGAQRVGKSTMAKDMETVLPKRYKYLDAGVSQFLKSLGTDATKNLEGEFGNQIEVQHQLGEHLLEKFISNDDFICDRSILDVYGYTKYIYDKNYYSMDSQTRQSYGNLMDDLVTMQMQSMVGVNSMIFVVNPNPNIKFVPDEKSGTEVSQQAVAKNILDISRDFKKYGIIEVIPDDCTRLADRRWFCVDALEYRSFLRD